MKLLEFRDFLIIFFSKMKKNWVGGSVKQKNKFLSPYDGCYYLKQYCTDHGSGNTPYLRFSRAYYVPLAVLLLASSLEPLNQFQPDLAYSIYG
jgi:hypothetical protein